MNKATTNDQAQALRAIGLTASAAQIYLRLAEKMPQSMTAHELHGAIQGSRGGVYKAVTELLTKGFITQRRIVEATHYQAIPTSQALENYALYQRQTLSELIRAQHEHQVLQISPLSVTISPR